MSKVPHVTLLDPETYQWPCDICGKITNQPLISLNHCGEDHAIRAHRYCLDQELDIVENPRMNV